MADGDITSKDEAMSLAEIIPDDPPPELLERVVGIIRDMRRAGRQTVEIARAVAPMLIAHGRELENAEVVAIIAKYGVASCNCMTKTPKAAFHLETCPYQRVALILDEIDEHRSKP